MRHAGLLIVGLTGCRALFGFEDPTKVPPPDGSQVCIDGCDCTTDTDCAMAEYCDDRITASSCECVAGFTRSTDTCEWTGVVAAPGFGDPAPWIVAEELVVDPIALESEMVDPGYAQFSRDNDCLGVVSQSFDMPRFSRAGALVAAMTHGQGLIVVPSLGSMFGVGAAWADVPDTEFIGFSTERTCLGLAHYAPETTSGSGVATSLAIAARGESIFCNNAELLVDRFEIAPALPDECPNPGEVINGDAEGDGGWTFTTTGTATGGLVSNVGEAGSRGARLRVLRLCDLSRTKMRLSLPVASSLGSPALAFFATSSGGILSVDPGTGRFTTLPNAATIHRSCIPAHLRGTVVELSFDQRSVNGGTCGDPTSATGAIDNLVVTDEPGCGTDPAIADPGFESGYQPFDTTKSGTGTLLVLADAGSAHTGTGVLRLRNTGCASSAILRQHIAVPANNGAAGPALLFSYRFEAATANTRFTVTGETAAVTPTRDTEWKDAVLCLRPRLPNRVEEVAFQLSDASGCTGAFDEAVFIDDLRAGTDPSCPTQ